MFALFLFCARVVFINGQFEPILTETDHFYLINSKLSYLEAQDFCNNTFGTTLGEIKNDLYNSELGVIFTRFNYINNIWIGNTEKENYNNWGIKPSDNNLNCIVSKSLLGNWYINNCNLKEYFICNKFYLKNKNLELISRLNRRLLEELSPTSGGPTTPPTSSPTPPPTTNSTEIYPISVFNETKPIFMYNSNISCGARNAIKTLTTNCPFGWHVKTTNLYGDKFAIYEFNKSVILTQFSIQNFGNNDTDIRSFDLFASNISTSVDISIISGGLMTQNDNTIQRLDITNTNSFQYWKIVITSTFNYNRVRVNLFGFYQ